MALHNTYELEKNNRNSAKPRIFRILEIDFIFN